MFIYLGQIVSFLLNMNWWVDRAGGVSGGAGETVATIWTLELWWRTIYAVPTGSGAELTFTSSLSSHATPSKKPLFDRLLTFTSGNCHDNGVLYLLNVHKEYHLGIARRTVWCWDWCKHVWLLFVAQLAVYRTLADVVAAVKNSRNQDSDNVEDIEDRAALAVATFESSLGLDRHKVSQSFHLNSYF